MFYTLHALQDQVYDVQNQCADQPSNIVTLTIANTASALHFFYDSENRSAGLLMLASAASQVNSLDSSYRMPLMKAFREDLIAIENDESLSTSELWNGSIPQIFANLIISATLQHKDEKHFYFKEYQAFLSGDYQNEKSWNHYEVEWLELTGKAVVQMPRVFISYSRESKDHEKWALNLALKLRIRGVNARIDQLHIQAGMSLTEFMEEEVSECDFSIAICTPTYKEKSDKRRGGVGYEEQILSAQLLSGELKNRVIPVLRKGAFEGETCAIPRSLLGILGVDMCVDEEFEEKLKELLKPIMQGHTDLKDTQ